MPQLSFDIEELELEMIQSLQEISPAEVEGELPKNAFNSKDYELAELEKQLLAGLQGITPNNPS